MICAGVMLWAASPGCERQPVPKGNSPNTGQEADRTTSAESSNQTVTVFIAASTKDAVAEITARFNEHSSIRVKLSPGASSTLATQILADAPGDLFLSAGEDWAEKVQEAGRASRICRLLTNALVLVVPRNNPGNVKTPADLLTAGVQHVALAGENVPAGRYAEQALRTAKVYQGLLDHNKIARGQDVRFALGFVQRGEAEAGIVYASDAKIAPELEVAYTFGADAHDAIVYPLVLLKSAECDDAALKFFEFLQSPAAKEVFVRYGFAPAN